MPVNAGSSAPDELQADDVIDRPQPSSPAQTTIPAVVALAAIGLLAAWTRLVGLDISLWWDEVSTAQHYVVRGPSAIFDPENYIPNNHVLFSLLAWATTSLVGLTERTLRLWSVLPGLVSIVVLAWWAWHRLGRWAAVVLALLVALSPIHLEFAPQARGYGLAFLAAAVMIAAGSRASESGRVRDVVVWAAGGLAGVLTLPTMVFPFLLHGAVILLRPDRRTRIAVVAAVGTAGVASLAFYAPLLPAITDETTAVGSRIGAAPGLIEGATLPLRLLVEPSSRYGLPFLPARLGLVVAALLLVAGTIALWRTRRDRPLLLHLLVPPLGTMLALGVVGFHVQDRYISFLLFHLLVLVAVALVWAGGEAARQVGRWPVVGASVLVVWFALLGTLPLSTAFTSLPRENFQGVALVLGDDHPERVITNRRHPIGFQHYLGLERSDLEIVDPADAPELVCTAEPPFVFLDYPFQAESADHSCLEARGAFHVAVPQRVGPEAIHVWVLEAGGG